MSLITITEAALLAGCSDKTLRRAIDAGELQTQPRTHKNQPILIDLAVLKLYLETRGVQLPEILSQMTVQPAQATGADTDLAARISTLEGKIGERSDLTLTAVAEKHNALALMVKRLIHEKQGNEALMQRIEALERRILEVTEERENDRRLGGGAGYQALTLAALENKLNTFQAWVEPFLKQHHEDIERYRQAIDALEKFEVWATGLFKQVSDQLGAEQRLTTWLKDRLEKLGREKSTFAISEELQEVKKRVAALEQERTVAQQADGSMNTSRARTEEMRDLVKRIEQLETDEAHDVADITRSIEKMDSRVGTQFDKHKKAITDTVDKLNELIRSFTDFHKLITDEIKDINGSISDMRAAKSRQRRSKGKDTTDTTEEKEAPVILYVFAAAHDVPLAMVKAVIEKGILRPVGARDDLYLNAEGQKRFWQIFNHGPHWQDCPDCPHGAEVNGKP